MLCLLTTNRPTVEGKQKIKSWSKLKGVDEVQCLCVVVCCRVQIVGSDGVWSENNRGSKQEGAPHLTSNCRVAQFYQYSTDAGCHLVALLSIHRHSHHSIGWGNWESLAALYQFWFPLNKRPENHFGYSAAKRKHLPFQRCYLVCVSRLRRVSQEQKQGFGWELDMVICVKNGIVEEEKEHPGGKPIPCVFGVLHHLMKKSEEIVAEVLGKHLDLREGVG